MAHLVKAESVKRIMGIERIARAGTGAVTTAFVAALLLIAPSGAGAAVELKGIVPYDYFYKLTWHPQKRELTGHGTAEVENRSTVAKRYLWLRLRANRGDELQRISFRHGARIVRRAAGGSMLRVRLNEPVQPGRYRTIRFGLRLQVPQERSSLGRSAGIDLFGDALPVVASGDRHGVRIGPEPAYGEGSLNPVTDWLVEVHVPRGLRVLMPGKQWMMDRYEGDRSSRYAASVTARDFAFAIGQFRRLKEKVDGVEVSVAGAAELRDRLPVVLRRTVHAFKTLQRWYGGYNLPSLKVVVGDLPFGGSEYPGLVFSTPDNATIAHEVAHQWFYGLVGNDQYRDPFLDESLTAYAEQQFHRSYRCNLASPIDGRKHGLGTGMDYWQKHPKEYEQTIYRGGACALTVLRRDIGRTAFDNALRAYVQGNVDQIAGVDDFLAAVRAAAPSYDLARWERLVGLR